MTVTKTDFKEAIEYLAAIEMECPECVNIVDKEGWGSVCQCKGSGRVPMWPMLRYVCTDCFQYPNEWPCNDIKRHTEQTDKPMNAVLGRIRELGGSYVLNEKYASVLITGKAAISGGDTDHERLVFALAEACKQMEG